MLLRRVFFVAWMIILHSQILCQVQPDHPDNPINREKEDEEDDEEKDPYDGRLKFPPFSFSHNDIMEKQKSKLKGDSDYLRLPYKGFPKHGNPPQDCDGEVKSHDDGKQGDHLSPTSYKVYGSPYLENKNDNEDNEEQPSNDHSNNKHPHEYKDYRSPGSYLPYGNEFYKQRQSFIKTGNIKKPHSEKIHMHDGMTKDKRHTGFQKMVPDVHDLVVTLLKRRKIKSNGGMIHQKKAKSLKKNKEKNKYKVKSKMKQQ